jgi:hypothetical protein
VSRRPRWPRQVHWWLSRVAVAGIFDGAGIIANKIRLCKQTLMNGRFSAKSVAESTWATRRETGSRNIWNGLTQPRRSFEFCTTPTFPENSKKTFIKRKNPTSWRRIRSNFFAYYPKDQGILKWKISLYGWPPVWLVWNQLDDNWQVLFLFAKQANPNRSNRRSVVQWYFPL